MKKLVLALPKGSLEGPILDLLKRVGVNVVFSGRSFQIELSDNCLFGRVILLRPQKIPRAVASGITDAGLTGLDWVAEQGLEKKLEIVAKLAFGRNSRQTTKIVVFGKTDKLIDRSSIRVSAEYLNLARKVFKRASIDFSDGGTEADVLTGVYDYGVGVYDSGRSLKENGLKVARVIMESPVVLIARQSYPGLKFFGEMLKGVLAADKRVLVKFNCAEKDKEAILKFLPAIDAPTISRLSDGDYAVETVADKDQLFGLLLELRGAGASGILVQDFNVVLAG